MLQLPAALEAFDSHGLRAQNDRLIDIPDMITVLTSLYEVSRKSRILKFSSIRLIFSSMIGWIIFTRAPKNQVNLAL